MIEQSGELACVSAPMTMGTAASLMQKGVDAIDNGARSFDLSGASEIDSAALAVLFAWMRHAQVVGANLRLQGLPPHIQGLAEVYDVSDVIAGHLATSA